MPWEMDGGIRPLVVGELLRAVVAKIAAKQGAEAGYSLLPLQIGVGGNGPWLPAGVLIVRSWISTKRTRDD